MNEEDSGYSNQADNEEDEQCDQAYYGQEDEENSHSEVDQTSGAQTSIN